jgi:hypothetical protein
MKILRKLRRAAFRYCEGFPIKLGNLNSRFNSLQWRQKKTILIVSGVIIAISCVLAVADGFSSHPSIALPSSIAQPIKENANIQDAHLNSLIPVGSMISIDPEVDTSFLVAMDNKGLLMVTSVHHAADDARTSTWRPVTVEQLRELEVKFRFVPSYRSSIETSK